ncbi:MAG TPA: DinB family protein [Chitinophagaceae bacterium]|nr:DinB family protein [Chitinophagaceae bacterium]
MEMQSYLSTRLQYQHKALLDIIDGLSDELIRRQLTPGKWSIFENIVHLQTYQHVFCARIKKMLEENNPSFPRYSADTDPVFLENCGKTIREIMGNLITTRKEMSMGSLSIKEKDLQRTGTHPTFGTMTIAQWLNFFLLHEAHHIFTVFKMAAELKKASSL